MNFWDSSALNAVLLAEAESGRIKRVLRVDPGIVVWWGSRAECASAIFRKTREGRLVDSDLEPVLDRLHHIMTDALVIRPEDALLDTAIRLMRRNSLSAADAVQLSAAVTWCRERPQGKGFVCLDQRLREAARREGFRLLPE